MELADSQFVAQLNHDPLVRSNTLGWDFPGSLASQQAWFSEMGPSSTERWIVENLAGDPIGLTGLWGVNWHDRNAESGIKLGGRAPQRGQGFATDAIMSVMAFSFYDVGLERLYAQVSAENVRSLRLYTERCGWTVEGRARNHVWRDGAFVDVVQVGILRGEFDSLELSRTYRDLNSSQGRV